jgi:serine/threonine-protein kinase
LTGSGHFLGTPDYMAPEQIEGAGADGRTDQYALACSAFELLAGTVPFARSEGWATVWAHLNTGPPALSALRPGLSPAADPVLARAMAKSPQDRYPSCREFANALCAALDTAPYPPRLGPTRTAARSATGRASGHGAA